MRRLNSQEAALTERLTQVLESDNPTTEELVITLEISPEDLLERFPDRIYELREKIVDDKIIFGGPDGEPEEDEYWDVGEPFEEDDEDEEEDYIEGPIHPEEE